MIKIYHNPSCSKSREGLEIIKKSEKEFTIIKYLEDTPTKLELKEIIKKLGIKPIDLVRTSETIWKSDYKDKNLTEEEIIEVMIKYPKLIERPIVVNEKKAVIGRPPQKILDIL